MESNDFSTTTEYRPDKATIMGATMPPHSLLAGLPEGARLLSSNSGNSYRRFFLRIFGLFVSLVH